MKVMCIDDRFPNEIMLKPVIGKTYEVYQSKTRQDCWSVPSLPFPPTGEPGNYHKRLFIPLSDIDETETEVYKNPQTQTV